MNIGCGDTLGGRNMKMRKTDDYSLLFKFACQLLKYFLLVLVGFGVSCILSATISAHLLEGLLTLWGGLWRLGVLIFCFLFVAVVVESWR